MYMDLHIYGNTQFGVHGQFFRKYMYSLIMLRRRAEILTSHLGDSGIKIRPSNCSKHGASPVERNYQIW